MKCEPLGLSERTLQKVRARGLATAAAASRLRPCSFHARPRLTLSPLRPVRHFIHLLPIPYTAAIFPAAAAAHRARLPVRLRLLDAVLELLVRTGRDIAQAVMLMIPEAWQNDKLMPQVRREVVAGWWMGRVLCGRGAAEKRDGAR